MAGKGRIKSIRTSILELEKGVYFDLVLTVCGDGRNIGQKVVVGGRLEFEGLMCICFVWI